MPFERRSRAKGKAAAGATGRAGEPRPRGQSALGALPRGQSTGEAARSSSAASIAVGASGEPRSQDLPPAVRELLVILEGRWPESDLDVVVRAYRLAEEAHRGQTRLSGEPYISHPLAVARILAEIGLDPIAAAAALLHDVLEDTDVSEERIRAEVGSEVLQLVCGLTKIEIAETATEKVAPGKDRAAQGGADGGTGDGATGDGAPPRSRGRHEDRSLPASRPAGADWDTEEGRRRAKRTVREAEAETIRRIFMSASVDIRVLLIKLADRLHNMRTARWLPEERQRDLAQQTERIYAPLAERLGLWQLKTELEDLSLRILEPDVYAAIESVVARDLEETEHYLGAAIHELDEALRRHGLKGEVSGRIKHYASIRNKLRRLEAQPAEIPEVLRDVQDILALRVVLDGDDTHQCYAALGIVHTIWQPIEGTVDDYIACPKSNHYQSLHTTVTGPEERVLEVQIRTARMHEVAELGVAAHWAYKQQSPPDSGGLAAVRDLRVRLDEAMKLHRDAREFVGDVSDWLSAQVRILTPKGDILELPTGATPIDVAYAIHTEVGHRCRGAKVDGRLVALNTPLRTGQRVQILTAKGPAGPSRDWLNPDLGYTATTLARARIRQWFRRQERSAAVSAGRQILERQLRRLGLTRTRHETVARLFDYRDVEEFYLALGRTLIAPEAVSQRLVERDSERQNSSSTIAPATPVVHSNARLPDTPTIAGAAGDTALAMRLARCCGPLPGDAVMGYVTRGRGITLHRRGCANIRALREREPERFVAIDWQPDRQQGHAVKLRIVAYDRAGLVRDISQIIAHYDVSMDSVTAVANPVDGTATVTAVVRLPSLGLLVALMDRLETVENVIDVRRAP